MNSDKSIGTIASDSKQAGVAAWAAGNGGQGWNGVRPGGGGRGGLSTSDLRAGCTRPAPACSVARRRGGGVRGLPLSRAAGTRITWPGAVASRRGPALRRAHWQCTGRGAVAGLAGCRGSGAAEAGADAGPGRMRGARVRVVRPAGQQATRLRVGAPAGPEPGSSFRRARGVDWLRQPCYHLSTRGDAMFF